MKLNVSTDATSSSDSRVSTRACWSPQVTSIGPKQIVFTMSTLNFGGAKLPLYTHSVGVPSSKLNRYANHSVGWINAGSVRWKPLNSTPWDSSRVTESN